MAFADRLLVNKVDLVSENDLLRVEGRLRELNQFAPIKRTQNAAVALEEVRHVTVTVCNRSRVQLCGTVAVWNRVEPSP